MTSPSTAFDSSTAIERSSSSGKPVFDRCSSMAELYPSTTASPASTCYSTTPMFESQGVCPALLGSPEQLFQADFVLSDYSCDMAPFTVTRDPTEGSDFSFEWMGYNTSPLSAAYQEPDHRDSAIHGLLDARICDQQLSPRNTRQSVILAPKEICSDSVSQLLIPTRMPLKAGGKRSLSSASTAESSASESLSSLGSEEDHTAARRRRNTMAARRFRKRKEDHVSNLESRLEEVTKDRDSLRLQVAKWEGEVMALRKLLEHKANI
ncbi:hypothetical protein ASPZODRAFT_133640 [Penicilliopsis zonata CBS 506.65]|uniref:BZIP domain-containing protein n=1 Tax=Penicilliopsis zonata CBS 506.65 TaxID=1073090 RepID=A0A1L9SF52_9EURO|nr:hypothetical protein ASPZODRAFT_133640 [Penicilliopsis zonata CBS 506.65]OJJ45772.1 hypothetical protein ASPZODRAFT_133640 [Penicilliopsis zonata CBS 506.65]